MTAATKFWIALRRFTRQAPIRSENSRPAKAKPPSQVVRHRIAGIRLAWLLAVPAISLVAEELRRDATVRAVEKALPSIVNIQTEILVERRDFYHEFFWDFFDLYHRKSRPAYSLGSGVLIDDDGYLLTNAHVVQRASRIEVVLHDGRKYAAETLAEDNQSDIALLRILKASGEKFPAIRFAKSGDLLLGETVIALGNPFGLGSSISKGILSSKNRRPEIEGSPDVDDWLQTDAAINPGNSGGPLINLHGEMIGLNIAIFKDAQGIGFAIPIKRVAEALGEIFESLAGLWFGARVDAAQQPLAVSAVQPGTPAAEGGLRLGDQILAINNQPVTTIIDYYQELTRSRDTTPATISISRHGQSKTLEIPLVPEEQHFNAELIRKRTGATLQQLTPDLRRYFGLRRVRGFIVADIEPNSPATQARLQERFVITAFNGHTVQTITDAAKIIDALTPGETLILQTLAKDSRGHFLSIKIPLTLN